MLLTCFSFVIKGLSEPDTTPAILIEEGGCFEQDQPPSILSEEDRRSEPDPTASPTFRGNEGCSEVGHTCFFCKHPDTLYILRYIAATYLTYCRV